MASALPLTRTRAGLQAVALVAILYAYFLGNASLGGSASLENTNIVASALLTGTLMLLITGLLVRRDANWLSSLNLRRMPPIEALAFGALGVVLCYVAGGIGVTLYTWLASSFEAAAAHNLTVAERFRKVPLYAVVPLSLFVGLWEEIVFRGFLLNRLIAVFKGDTRLAVVVTAAAFGIGHFYQGTQGQIQTAAIGVALGAVVVWRKSLWPAVIAHWGIDTIGLLVVKALPAIQRVLQTKGH